MVLRIYMRQFRHIYKLLQTTIITKLNLISYQTMNSNEWNLFEY